MTPYKRLGDYIREVNVRNRELKVTNLLGVNLSKQFFPSIANIIGTDLSKYKIIEKGQFGCNFMSVGRDGILPISLKQEEKPAIISSAYYVFEVKDQEVLLPEYLMMWLRRPEFDRQLWFFSGGDVRGGVNYDDFCEMPIIIPSIARQREIVAEYETLTNRIRLNNQMIQHLEATAQALYRKTFVDNIDKENLPTGWRMGTLGEVAYYVEEKMSLSDIDESSYVTTENMLKDKKGIIISTQKPKEGRGTKFTIDDVLVSNIRPYFKKIWRASFNGVSSNDVLCFRAKNEFNASLLYYTIEQDGFFDYVMAGSNGVKMPRGDKEWIMNYPVIIPSENCVKEYDKATTCMHLQSVRRKQENTKLTELQSLLLAKMGQ